VALLAFTLLVLVGGSNTVAVKCSNFELPSFWGADRQRFERLPVAVLDGQAQ
jgi:hypothetical protein